MAKKELFTNFLFKILSKTLENYKIFRIFRPRRKSPLSKPQRPEFAGQAQTKGWKKWGFATISFRKSVATISSLRDKKNLSQKTNLSKNKAAQSEERAHRKTNSSEHSNKFFLLPLLFATGCIFYFSFPSSFAALLPAFFACFLTAILLIFCNRNSPFFLPTLVIAMFLAGSFYGLAYDKIFLNYQKITGKIYVVGEGKIVAIKKFHNPRNNLDGVNLLIAPHSLRKPQNLETAKFFAQKIGRAHV